MHGPTSTPVRPDIGQNCTPVYTPEDSCGADIIVLTRWHNRPLGVPLSQLTPQGVDAGTAEAIAD